MKPNSQVEYLNTSDENVVVRNEKKGSKQIFRIMIVFIILVAIYLVISFSLLNILKTSYGDLLISIIVTTRLTTIIFRFLQKKRVLPFNHTQF